MAWVRHVRCNQPNNLTELIYLYGRKLKFSDLHFVWSFQSTRCEDLTWVNRGILKVHVCNPFDTQGHFLCFEDFKCKFGVRCTFLDYRVYLGVKTSEVLSLFCSYY